VAGVPTGPAIGGKFTPALLALLYLEVRGPRRHPTKHVVVLGPIKGVCLATASLDSPCAAAAIANWRLGRRRMLWLETGGIMRAVVDEGRTRVGWEKGGDDKNR
jgi:hypothetical protein